MNDRPIRWKHPLRLPLPHGLRGGSRFPLLLAGMLGTTACIEQTPETLLTDLRLVAAVVEPPEVQPGMPVRVLWEVVDGQETVSRPLTYLFVACSRIQGLGDCLEFSDLVVNPAWVTSELTPTEEGYREYLRRYSQQGEMTPGSLDIQQFTAYSLQFLLTENGNPPPPTEEGSEQALPLFSELSGELRLLVCAEDACAELLEEVASAKDGLPLSRSVASLYKEITSSAVLEDRDPAQTALALKAYLLSRRPLDQRNRNPMLEGLVLSGDALADGLDTGETEPLAVTGATTLTLTVGVDTSSYESYTLLDDAGSPVPSDERLEVRWYSTQGSPVTAPRDIPTGPPFLQGEDSSPTPLPTQFEAYFELPAVDDTPIPALFFVVVTDPRGGSAYFRRAVEIQ